MDNRIVVITAAAMALGGLVGCSSSAPEYQPPAGALPSGAVQVTIGGQDLGTSYATTCQPIGTVTTISTGDDAAGTTSAVDSVDGLTAQYVQIRNLGGFTGNYWQGVDGEAEVKATGTTFVITGRANGFKTDNPSFRTTEDFELRVSC